MEFQGVTVSDLYMLVNSNDPEYKKVLDSLKEVFLEGWVRTNRDNGSVGFIALSVERFIKLKRTFVPPTSASKTGYVSI